MIMKLVTIATIIGFGTFILYKLYRLLPLLWSIRNAMEVHDREFLKLYSEIDHLRKEISDFSAVLKTSEMKLDQFSPDCYWARIAALQIVDEIFSKNYRKHHGDDNVSTGG